MKNTVWAEARKRARAETFELIRLSDRTRATLTLGAPLLTIAFFWIISRQLALATALGLLATFVVGLLIYLTKLLSAPAKIAEEARSRLSTEAAEEEQAERARRRSVITRLVDLYCLELADGAPAAVRAGLELPPEEWLNEHLAELGEVWHVFNIRGTSYQTFEVIAGEWRYRGRRLRSPAAIKWAAFFDGLGLNWDLASEHLDQQEATPVDLYLLELNAWFVAAFPREWERMEHFSELHRRTQKRVIVADGPPSYAKENLRLVDDDALSSEGEWAWAEDRRDKDVYWFTKLDGTAGVCLGGPGTQTDHDRPPIIGARVMAAFEKAKEQATEFDKRK